MARDSSSWLTGRIPNLIGRAPPVGTAWAPGRASAARVCVGGVAPRTHQASGPALSPVGWFQAFQRSSLPASQRAQPCVPPPARPPPGSRSEEHTSELQSHLNLVCRLPLESREETCPAKGHYLSTVLERTRGGRAARS